MYNSIIISVDVYYTRVGCEQAHAGIKVKKVVLLL